MVLLLTPFNADHQFHGTHVPVFLSHWLTESSSKLIFKPVAFLLLRRFVARYTFGLWTYLIHYRACLSACNVLVSFNTVLKFDSSRIPHAVYANEITPGAAIRTAVYSANEQMFTMSRPIWNKDIIPYSRGCTVAFTVT